MEARPLSKPLLALGALLAAIILASYEIARPATESLFLTAHTSASLPKVWLFVVVGVAIAVAGYTRLAAQLRLDRLIALLAISSSAGLLVIQGLMDADVPGAAYVLYVWKDVYIVVLLEAFWTLANTVFRTGQARWIYGLFCAMGSLGAVAGARLCRGITAWADTETSLWAVHPLLLIAALIALGAGRSVADQLAIKTNKRPTWAAGVELLKSSRYLIWMVGLILVTQLVINLVDFQFNTVIEQTFSIEADRTAAISRVYEWISWGALSMQLATGPLLALLGVRGALLLIPLLVGGSLATLLISPQVLIAQITKALGKTMDYSLFRAAKEILYIPLSYAEKTQGKALVDILTYRTAKGGAAIVLQALLSLGAAALIGWITLGLVGLWVGIVWVIGRRYYALCQVA